MDSQLMDRAIEMRSCNARAERVERRQLPLENSQDCRPISPA